MLPNSVTASTDPVPRAIPELDEAWNVWPRGDRTDALRGAAERFKERFVDSGVVTSVQSIDIATAPYPVAFAFHGAARSINPYISILNRMLVIRFQDFGGADRILVWEPTVPAGAELAPFYHQLAHAARRNPLLSAGRRITNRTYNTLETALSRAGVDAGDVDYIAFDHLHVQDPRMILPVFPRARMIVQEDEMATLDAPHAMQWAWYVQDGASGIDESRLLRIDGSIELGVGVAVVATPGHTDGNQSIVLNSDSGVWVSSENGVSADNWQPEQSRIPGVRRYSRFYGREVCPNANTLEDSIDQYDSMVLEKTLADRARDSRWLQVLPSSELVPWRFQWPIVPSYFHGPLSSGRPVTRTR